MNATKLTKIWEATAEWLDIAERQGMVLNYDAEPITDEWDAACELAGFDAEDSEVGFALIVETRDCDTLLKAGDIVATSGHGGDVAFLRR